MTSESILGQHSRCSKIIDSEIKDDYNLNYKVKIQQTKKTIGYLIEFESTSYTHLNLN